MPWELNGSSAYYNDGNVGVGTASPGYPLHVESSAASPIHGLYTGSAGSKYGVYGRTDSSASTRGVFGYATAPNGFTTGVQGRSNSATGTGVSGYAFASSGENYGVLGSTNSPDGYAGYFVGRGYFSDRVGIGTTSPAKALHVEGFSNLGSVVYARNSSLSSNTYAIEAETASPQGRAVLGRATATSGNCSGVRGETTSTAGLGVMGVAMAPAGPTIAVFGDCSSSSGVAVYALARADSGTNYGVIGVSASTSGYDFFAAGAGSNYGSASSIRWKRNVENIDRPLEKLARMRGVFFDWDEEHGGHHDVGMIAEEVGAVLPEIVTYEENGIDASGMDYSKLTPVLVEAVNALRAQTESQKREIDELRDRLATLEALVTPHQAAGGEQ